MKIRYQHRIEEMEQYKRDLDFLIEKIKAKEGGMKSLLYIEFGVLMEEQK